MKIVTKAIWLTAMTVMLLVHSSSAMAQKKCGTKEGEAYEQVIFNASADVMTVKMVDEKCNETVATVKPGRSYTQPQAYKGYLFNVTAGSIVKEISALRRFPAIWIGIVENADAGKSFLDTVNQFRRGYKLPPFEMDDALNKAAQWQAELNAKFGVLDHDAVIVGGDSYASMQSHTQRANSFGFKGEDVVEGLAEELLSNGLTLNRMGGALALDWSASDTHHKGFFNLDGEVYTHIGFGLAKSVKDPNVFYGAVLFGNPAGDTAQEETNGNVVKHAANR